MLYYDWTHPVAPWLLLCGATRIQDARFPAPENFVHLPLHVAGVGEYAAGPGPELDSVMVRLGFEVNP